MGDMNIIVRKDGSIHNVDRHSLHEVSHYNGMRLTDFSISRNVVISSTRFPHKHINTETWISPDGQLKNEIDQVLMDA
jgi:hypothetical protein